jgi:transcriptional regulator with XRE-family HTH domain
MEIGERIRKLRKARGWTMDDLVTALKEVNYAVHRNTIQRWETGAREPRYSDLIALRNVLGLQLNGQEESDARRCRKQPSSGE